MKKHVHMSGSPTGRGTGVQRTPVALIAVAAAAATLAGCGTAPKGANVYDVGRVHVVMPVAGWQVRDLPKSAGRVSSAAADFNADYDMPRKLLSLPRSGGQGLQALMFVTTSPGVAASGRGVIADAKCKDESGDAYVYDMSGNPRSPACVKAWSGRSSKDFFGEGDKVGLGDRIKVVQVTTMNSRAAQVNILALMSSDFVGQAEAKPAGRVPTGFPTDLAAWADVLGREARDATSSLSGTLQVPPGVFH